MAKQAHHKKISHKDGLMLEQNSMYDDSLLPPSEELARLSEINPNIISWIMERTSIEQTERHAFNRERTNMAKFEFRGTRRYNLCALIFAFLVIISGFSFSAFLIHNSHDIMGTIFAGGTLVLAANAFIKASKKTI